MMSNLSNIKIAISDDATLDVITKLLEGLGYALGYQTESEPRIVITWFNNKEYSILDMCIDDAFFQDEISLSDLEMMYEEAKADAEEN